MIEELELQNQTPKYRELSFEERLGLAVDREVTGRQNRRYDRRIREAKLKEKAMVEDIDWRASRGLDKSSVLSLASCQWIREHQNIILTGKTGTGKSWLSCALAQRACLEGFTAYFIRIRRFFDDIANSRLDGTYHKLMASLARYDVLVLDDWGPKLTESERRELAEVIDDRVGAQSTIITSQIPVDKWHEVIGDPSAADSILDRLVHRAHHIKLSGPSLRGEYQAIKTKTPPSDKTKSRAGDMT
jgi:DNA replication protein DnaC